MTPINSSAGSTRIKTVAIKRKKSEEKIKIINNMAAPKAVKAPKRTKLAVRVVGKGFQHNSGGREEAAVAVKERAMPADAKPGREKKSSSAEAKILSFSEKTEKRNKAAAPDASIPGDGGKKDARFDQSSKLKAKKEPSPSLYRKIFFSFLFLTAILLAAVFYLYFVTLTIEVEPKKERLSDKVSFRVANGEKSETLAAENFISGAVEKIEVKKENTYKTTGEEILGHEIFGEVVLINNTAEDRPLVATTRLLSPDGRLFRLKDRVLIPANGKITAEIYTDEPSQEMALAPGSFTIPGLWAGLQDKVYAENKAAFVYKQEIKKTVKQSDLDKAAEDLKALLLSEVKEKLGQNYKGFDKVILEVDEGTIKTEAGAEAGEEAEEFKVSMSATVRIAAFNRASAEQLAENKFLSSLPADKKISSLDKDKMDFTLFESDFDKGETGVEAAFIGYAVSKKADNLLDKKKIVGLNESQIKDYLNGLDKFSEYEIKFWPSFIKKAPALADRIKVIVKE